MVSFFQRIIEMVELVRIFSEKVESIDVVDCQCLFSDMICDSCREEKVDAARSGAAEKRKRTIGHIASGSLTGRRHRCRKAMNCEKKKERLMRTSTFLWDKIGNYALFQRKRFMALWKASAEFAMTESSTQNAKRT